VRSRGEPESCGGPVTVRTTRSETADYVIGATALVTGCELATLNVRHIPMLEELAPPFSLG
jgi:predicted nucleic acid-binding protein